MLAGLYENSRKDDQIFILDVLVYALAVEDQAQIVNFLEALKKVLYMSHNLNFAVE